MAKQFSSRKFTNTVLNIALKVHVIAEPEISIGSVHDLRTGGLRFDHQLGQYSFLGLMIVIATGFVPRCPLFQQWLCGKAASGLERTLCGVLVKRTPGKEGIKLKYC